jgi:ethanolamine utilization microcompartment shell protein EutS
VVVASLAMPVLAPAAAPDLGVSATLIGYYASIVYACAMASTVLAVGFVNRFGAVRVIQGTLVTGAAALLLAATGNLVLVVASAVFAGLAFGPTNPSS